MYGAIIGDIAGSIYEYDQIKNVHPIYIDKIIPDNGFYSDDTILTICILDSIINNIDYNENLRKYINEYKDYRPNFNPYFKSSFSPNLIKWSNNEGNGNSRGNGAMMRVSPVGYLFNNIEDVKNNAYLSTIPSHKSIEAIDSAGIVASIIYYARMGYSKEEILKILNLKYNKYDFKKFNTLCYETLPNCLYSVFTSNSYEESIKKILSFGGDTDTNACIVGSISEALYGIDDELISICKSKIPSNFNELLSEGYKRIKKLN